jgi:hypothetical protein
MSMVARGPGPTETHNRDKGPRPVSFSPGEKDKGRGPVSFSRGGKDTGRGPLSLFCPWGGYTVYGVLNIAPEPGHRTRSGVLSGGGKGQRTRSGVLSGGGKGQRTRSFVPVLGFSQETGSRPSESLVVVGLPGFPWAVQGLGFRFWEAPAAKYCSGSNHFLTIPTTVCRS